jgi:hypothetical protein
VGIREVDLAAFFGVKSYRVARCHGKRLECGSSLPLSGSEARFRPECAGDPPQTSAASELA